jgi:hypothetical protein
VAASAQTTGATFVVITAEYKWTDGLVSAAGEVERVLAVDGDDYIIWHESGRRYRLPKRFGQIITAEDAALRLIELRQQLYAEIGALYEELDSAPQPTEPARNSGISKNDRIRMLYVLREEKLISSIRRGEQMSDSDILNLYNRAMDQRRLRGLESAIQGLQR